MGERSPGIGARRCSDECSGTFQPGYEDLLTGRSSHTLLAGGSASTNLIAELYNPLTAWKATSSLKYGRTAGATMSLLWNGKVLIAGGTGYTGTTNSVELYDPASGMWAVTNFMAVGRAYHTATVLTNGQVLVAGGHSLSSSELYDPTNGVWTPAGNLSVARGWYTATLLPNGHVLAAGGGTSVSSADIYDPGTETWIPTDPMLAPRWHQAAALLANGKVLVAGGDADSSGVNLSITAEIFDPQAGATLAVVLVPAGTLINGVFQFGFQATAGVSFTVWGSSDMSNWTSLGTMPESAPGQYVFSDAQAPAHVRRFYRVTSP